MNVAPSGAFGQQQQHRRGFKSALLEHNCSNNSAFGTIALNSNTSGNDNTATGFSALTANTVGRPKIPARVRGTLRFTRRAMPNTAAGYEALYSNTTGNDNTAFGATALQNNSTGTSNTAAGFQALLANTRPAPREHGHG